MPDLVGQDLYKNTVRALEGTDLAVPDTWNPIHQDLINNDVHLQNAKVSKTTTITAGSGLEGGGDLSASRTLSIAASGVSDAHIGDRTLDPDLAAPALTGPITSLLSWLAGRFKAILGTAGVFDAVPVTLQAVKTFIDSVTSAATPDAPMKRDAAGRAKVAAPSASDDIARKAEVDAALAASVQRGTANTDVQELHALVVPIDTRPWAVTSKNAAGKPIAIEIRDGATVVATIAYTYDSDNKTVTQQDLTFTVNGTPRTFRTTVTRDVDGHWSGWTRQEVI
ncbi:MAG: hypothetical protein ACOY94_19540 [Bacillota bacterium]